MRVEPGGAFDTCFCGNAIPIDGRFVIAQAWHPPRYGSGSVWFSRQVSLSPLKQKEGPINEPDDCQSNATASAV